MENKISNLVTRDEFSKAHARIMERFDELSHKISETKVETLKWMFFVCICQTACTVGIILVVIEALK